MMLLCYVHSVDAAAVVDGYFVHTVATTVLLKVFLLLLLPSNRSPNTTGIESFDNQIDLQLEVIVTIYSTVSYRLVILAVLLPP